MYKQVCSIRVLARTTFFILVMSFFAALEIAAFSSSALAESEVGVYSPMYCEESENNSLNVDVNIDHSATLNSGSIFGGSLTITNHASFDRNGVNGYVFLRLYNRDGIGYPVAMSESDTVTILANDRAQTLYDLTIPAHVEDGKYVLEVYVGQYEMETALAKVMANDEPDVQKYIFVEGSSDDVSAGLSDLTIGGNQVSFGEIQYIDGSLPVIEVMADVVNEGTTFVEGSVTGTFYNSLLPHDNSYSNQQTFDFLLVPEQTYKAKFQNPVTPGRHLLVIKIDTVKGSQSFVVPVVHTGFKEGVDTAPYVTDVYALEQEGSVEIGGCIDYLSATTYIHELPPFPVNDTLDYKISVSGLGDKKINDMTFDVAPGQAGFKELFGKPEGEYSTTIELEREGEVIDSLSIENTCGKACEEKAGIMSGKKVSPLKTFIGVTILLVIISLPLLGAYQVGRKGRSRRKEEPVELEDMEADTEEDGLNEV